MKKLICAIVVLVLFIGLGASVYYSGYHDAGEGIAMFSAIIFVIWDLGFIDAQRRPTRTRKG